MVGRARYSYLLEDADVRRWYENVARGSKVTADVYLRRLGLFCEHFNLSPKQLISLSESDLYNLLLDYVSFLENNGCAGSYIEFYPERLSEIFPHERKNIISFFEDAWMAYEECYREADVYGARLPAELIAKVFGVRKLVDYSREHPHFYDWMNKTFRQKLDEYFVDEDLKTLLCALLGYVGAGPERVLAACALNGMRLLLPS